MSRPFKFRVWDIENDEMVTEGVGIDIAGVPYTWPDDCHDSENASYYPDGDIMQYTGLTDKNGVEIYEGDVCRNERGEVGVITFMNGQFVSKYIPPHNWDPMEPVDGLLDRQEVIGNIWENPELLEDK